MQEWCDYGLRWAWDSPLQLQHSDWQFAEISANVPKINIEFRYNEKTTKPGTKINKYEMKYTQTYVEIGKRVGRKPKHKRKGIDE